ncbi:translation elongation factor Ts [Arsenophonus symbiont of Ornithomya chloropus]|uniref:translation elongation factor Ts n=1 Tax=Arsenophonus symbiont of Ornithomya chloropus TaxID=634121 RepID=UPI0032B10D64
MSEEITATLVKELRQRTGVGMMDCKKALIKANGNINIAIDDMRKAGKAKAAKKATRIATEGIIILKVSMDKKIAVLLELNCETDFVAKSSIFFEFANEILTFVIENNVFNINELKIKFEERREEIITKIGENIKISRIKILKGEKIGSYLHSFRIGVLVSASESADETILKHIAIHIAASKPEYLTPLDVPTDLISHERKIQLEIAMKSGKPFNIVEKMVTGRIKKFLQEISLTGQQFVMDPTKNVGLVLKEKKINVFDFVRIELGESDII